MRELKEEFGRWLEQYDWTWYATLTFRNMIRDTITVKKVFRRWVDKSVATRVDSPVSYFMAVECFPGSDGVHIHSLIDVGYDVTLWGVQNYFIIPFWRDWYERYGLARILLYDPRLGARYYLCKYVTKDIFDWDICIKGQH